MLNRRNLTKIRSKSMVGFLVSERLSALPPPGIPRGHVCSGPQRTKTARTVTRFMAAPFLKSKMDCRANLQLQLDLSVRACSTLQGFSSHRQKVSDIPTACSSYRSQSYKYYMYTWFSTSRCCSNIASEECLLELLPGRLRLQSVTRRSCSHSCATGWASPASYASEM